MLARNEALGPVGGLGLFLGDRQGQRALLDGILQVISMIGQFEVAIGDLGEHGVEGIGQMADFIVRILHGALRIVS